MKDNKTELIPFNALNNFMRPDFRVSVIRTALGALPDLPDQVRKPVDQLTKKHVRIHGFRNSEKAPAAAKAGPTVSAFEKHPEVAAAILAAWAESKPELRQQVYDLLKSRGWFLLPLQARREKLPGFFIHWPKAEDFEVLNQAFREAQPGTAATSDEISLMIVWVSSRLPYQLVEDTPEAVTKLVDFDLEQLMSGDEEAEPVAGE